MWKSAWRYQRDIVVICQIAPFKAKEKFQKTLEGNDTAYTMKDHLPQLRKKRKKSILNRYNQNGRCLSGVIDIRLHSTGLPRRTQCTMHRN